MPPSRLQLIQPSRGPFILRTAVPPLAKVHISLAMKLMPISTYLHQAFHVVHSRLNSIPGVSRTGEVATGNEGFARSSPLCPWSLLFGLFLFVQYVYVCIASTLGNWRRSFRPGAVLDLLGCLESLSIASTTFWITTGCFSMIKALARQNPPWSVGHVRMEGYHGCRTPPGLVRIHLSVVGSFPVGSCGWT
jgi:hypothetical protein